jgi:tRNA-(ms[2]io[6]A)-hydroxylase
VLRLRFATDSGWALEVLKDLDAFLQDHAHNERKVVQAALQLAAHNPRRRELVKAMIELAGEELTHFGQVHELLLQRGTHLGFDQPDPYAGGMHTLLRKADVKEYLLDRLLVFGVVEARGCERFQLIHEALPAGPLKSFYGDLYRAEARHHGLFTGLAERYFGRDTMHDRLDAILDAEAALVASLPHRSAVH